MIKIQTTWTCQILWDLSLKGFLTSLDNLVPTAVPTQQVVTGGLNSPSIVKQMQDQESKATDSPSQTIKTEELDGKSEEVKKEKKKVKKPKPKVRKRELFWCAAGQFFILNKAEFLKRVKMALMLFSLTWIVRKNRLHGQNTRLLMAEPISTTLKPRCLLGKNQMSLKLLARYCAFH